MTRISLQYNSVTNSHVATEVQGIFRLPGSARRTNQLKEIFNAPDKYGKGLDWDGYTVHDAANVLRRYLNQLPEPIVPLKLYEPFREPLRQHQLQAVGNVEAKESDIGNFDYDATIATYRTLITQLPPLNRQLLLYILDMLAIFAAKSNITKMTAANLAVIFQPGMLHHPDDDKIPEAYRLSQDVVIFLIDQQDNFLLGMPGTAADEKTKKEIESGPPPAAPATPTRGATALGRSVSTTSRSTNSSRLAGIRRNLSVSSRGSRASVIAAGPGTPGTPNAPGTPGVHRSNTVPSRKSPAVSQSRFSRPSESPNATPPTATPDMTISPPPQSSSQTPVAAAVTSPVPSPEPRTGSVAPSVDNASAIRDQSKERLLGGEGAANSTPASKPRTGLSNLLRSPASDDGSTRQPNKLRKKRQPQAVDAQPGGHDSATSLSAADPDQARFPSTVPLASADESSRQVSGTSNSGFDMTETVPTPRGDITPQPISEERNKLAPSQAQDPIPKPRPAPSSESGEQHGDKYDASTGNELDGEGTNAAPEKKRRWRFSVSAKRNHDEKQLAASQFSSQHGSSNYLAGHSDADLSKTSSASWRNRSTTNVADGPGVADLNPDALRRGSRDHAYTSDDKSPTTETSGSKGPISWFKRKIKEREDKEAEKERAKSPQRADVGPGSSSQNLGALANGDSASRQVSTASSSIDPLPEIPTAPSLSTEGQAVSVSSSSATASSRAPESSATAAQSRVDPGQLGGLAPNAQTGVYPVIPGKIEDYMNDSDREKLDTARAVANRDSLTKPIEETTTPRAVEITIDPAYKATEESIKANASDPEPTTPKASEVNAGLSALTSNPALSQPSAENKAS